MDRSEITPDRLRWFAGTSGPYTGRIRSALTMAADKIETLTAEHAGIIEFLGKHSTDQAAEIERLTETIRAFGRGDIVPITDKDAEMERLRAIAVRAQLVVNEWHAYGGVKEPIVDQLVALEELLGNEQETRE